MNLPVLDASLFLTGTEGEHQQFARDLCENFTKHGFCKVANHGFSDDLVAQVFEWVSRLVKRTLLS